MNLTQSIEIKDKEYRHGLVAAQIDVDLPLQLRALRKQRGWSQPELAERTGMKQPRFPIMEKPGGAHFTLETLRRLAEAFDVALIVRFAPFSELLDWSEHFNPDGFSVLSFDDERAGLEPKAGDMDEIAPAVLIGADAQDPAEENDPETPRQDMWIPPERSKPDTNRGLENTVIPIDRIRPLMESRKGPQSDGMASAQAASSQ